MSELNIFAVRLQNLTDYESKLITLLTQSEKAIAVRHTGSQTKENPHFHFIIHTIQKLATFRKSMQRTFTEGKGNKHMSIKNCDDDDKAYSYLFHETEDCLVYNNGFSESDLQRFKNLNETIQQDIADNTPTEICSRVVSRLLKNPTSISEREICYAIWRDLNENGKWFPNKYQMERWVYKIQAELANYHDSRSGSDRNFEKTMDLWYSNMFSRF